MKTTNIIAMALPMLFAPCAFAATWYVNPSGSDGATGADAGNAFATLQYAHDQAAAGDTIILSEGTHNLTAVFTPEKQLFIKGAGRDKTIVKQTTACQRVFSINTDSGRTPTGSVYEDFSITGADYSSQASDVYGAGLLLKAVCTIRNCDIYGNKMQQGLGVGVYISQGVLECCRIYDNVATDDTNTKSYGGGIYIPYIKNHVSPTLKNCLIFSNHAANYGGGITVNGNCSAQIYNCTITGNSVAECTYGASGFYSQGNDNFGMMENTVIVGNVDNGKNSKSWDSSRSNNKFSTEFRNCVFDYNPYGYDPITAEAADIFEDVGSLRWTPKYASVLIDAAYTNNYEGIGDVDVYGSGRVSGTKMDIGAVERDFSADALFVTASPAEFLSPSPAYGTYLFEEEGDELELSMPSESFSDEESGNEYAVTGWKLYFVNPATLEKTLVDSGEGNSYTYKNAGGCHILEWQFKSSAFSITVAVDGSGGTVESTSYVVKNGEAVSITAIPEPGYVVKQWSGDIPDGVDLTANPLVFVPVDSIDITVRFTSERYVSLTGSDANDGFTPETAWKDVCFAVSNMNWIGGGAVLNIGEGTHDVVRQIVITNSITMRGAGREKTILKPSGTNYRVIGIGGTKAYSGTTKNIIIEKLGITGARVTSSTHGCGIYVDQYASNVQLLDLDVSDNQNTAHCLGAGVYLNSATSYLRRSRVFNNRSEWNTGTGGGVCIGAKGGTVESTVIYGNTAFRSGGSDRGECGGGIHISGPGNIYNCTIVGNSDTQTGNLGGGGGFYAQVATFKMINTVVAGNNCPGSVSRFGTAWSHDPALSLSTLSNCFVNCAFDGEVIGVGAVECDASEFKTFEDGSVKPLPNFAGINAGDANAYALGNKDVSGMSRVSGGAVDIGAAEFDSSSVAVAFYPVKNEIFLGDSVSLKSVVSEGLSVSSFAWSVTNAAGSVVCTSAAETLDFTPEDYGSYGVSLAAVVGGETLTYEVPGAVTVTSEKIYVSSDADESAAVAPFATPETATASLSEAMKWAIDGSEVFVKGTNTASVNIAKAVTLTGVGGRSAATIKASSGRAAVLRHPGAVVRGVTITGGKYYRGPGAYIACGAVEDCCVSNCTVNGLSSYDCIGTVYLQGTDARMSRTIITGNEVTYNYGRGAGAYVRFGSIDNCLVVSNKAVTGAGIIAATEASVLNCTVAGNEDTGVNIGNAGVYAPGLFIGDASVRIINCASFTNLYDGVLVDWKSSLSDENNAAVFSNCAFTADDSLTLPSDTCVVISPCDFKDFVSYRQAVRGALQNAGSVDFVYPDGSLDLLGNRRVCGRVDIGCYEIWTGFYLRVR